MYIDPLNINVSAFVSNDPVIVWLPLNVFDEVVANPNALTWVELDTVPAGIDAFATKLAVSAKLDVTALLALVAKDADVAIDDVTVKLDVVANEEDNAKLEVVAWLADVANDEDIVKLDVVLSDAVATVHVVACAELETNPDGWLEFYHQ